MIVTVRRWTSIAAPRLKTRARARRIKTATVSQDRKKRIGFLETYKNMFEHQVNLMFQNELDN